MVECPGPSTTPHDAYADVVRGPDTSAEASLVVNPLAVDPCTSPVASPGLMDGEPSEGGTPVAEAPSNALVLALGSAGRPTIHNQLSVRPSTSASLQGQHNLQ